MTPDRWQQIEAVFQKAVDLEPADREIFLRDECREDSTLQIEVEKLLADYDAASSFIESPVWTDSYFINSSAKKEISESLDELTEEVEDNLIGRKIGVYKLTKELGRGGMGAVYFGIRDDGEFKQKVAIKLIKRGMDSDFIVRRFRHERQILASFDHPFIARLLDGGTTTDGLPYFVMEFVEGDTLYDFCDKKRLTIRERLEIFRQICAAVAYAHERAIIHRDIKPGNILFTKTGTPKLLDFGIAKVLDAELIHESVNPTASMMRLMTPDYASPEQVNGSEITSSSDIYSLGILLYELLTGHRPYNFSGRAIHEVSRVVCEILPKMPSETIGADENLIFRYAGAPEKVFETRSISKNDLKQTLAGKLDNIIMKSLAKEAGERYGSAEEFSEDLRRYLRGEEVKAEQFKLKSTERKLTEIKQSGAKSLAVLPFKVLNLVKAEDTGDEFLGVGLADALITRLSKIRRFVVRPTSSILGFEEKGIDPISAARKLDVAYILDGNIKKAGTRLRVTVQLLDVAENSTVWATSIDETVTDLFSLEDTLSTKVIEALLPQMTGGELVEFQKRGTESAEAFEQYLRGRYYFNTGTEEGFAKAFVSFHSAISADPNYAHAYAGIANYYSWLGIYGVLPPQECFQPAIQAAEKAVELDNDLAEAHAILGFSIHAGNFDHPKAVHHLTHALELNPHYADAFAWLAIVRFTEGRFQEGFILAERAAEIDPLTLFNHHNIAWGLYYARRFDESIRHYRKTISDFPDYGLAYYGLSKNLRFVGKTNEALEQIDKAGNIFGDSIFIMLAEAECFAAAGDTQKAENKLAELKKLAGERYVSPYQLALVYCYLKDKSAAFDALEKAADLNEAWLNWLAVEPVFDILREDTRFVRLSEKIGAKKISTEVWSFQNNETLLMDADELKNEFAANETSFSGIKSRRKLLKIIIPIAAVISLIFVLYMSKILTVSFQKGNQIVQTTNAKSLTLVVLPFKSENAETEQNIGIGMAESLSGKLGNIKKMTVISASSGRSLAEKDVNEIGRQLGVGYVLRGNLVQTNNEIKVSAELVNAINGENIWSETFAPDTGNLTGVQTKIAEKVWKSLEIEPSPVELQQVNKTPTKNDNAYELFLLGRYQMINRSPENLRKAINLFTQAREVDPDFAYAYVGLADAYALLNLYEIPPPTDAYAKAKENALKALSLDDGLAEAHASLAYVKFFKERDRAGAELEFRRAIQINPSYSTAHHWFALASAAMNNPTEAISEGNTAQQLDPLSPSIKSATAMTYFFNRQYQEGLEETDKALKIDSGFVPAYKVKRWIYQALGNYEAATNSFLRERSLSGGDDSPGWFVTQAQIEASGEKRAESLNKLNSAVADESVKNYPTAYSYEIALAYAAFGENQKALDWLEKAEANGDHSFNFLEVDARLDSLRNEPRYAALLKKLQTPRIVR